MEIDKNKMSLEKLRSQSTKEDPYTAENQKRFTLRMDSELFEKISALAKENRRSVAKEIECAVDLYLEIDKHERNSYNK